MTIHTITFVILTILSLAAAYLVRQAGTHLYR